MIETLLTSLLTTQSLFIVIGSFFISIMAVLVGGSMFFSVPFIQFFFPASSFGVIVGNIKVGSLFRGLGSTASTYKYIDFKAVLPMFALAFIGTIIGASLISNIDQIWLIPAIVIAIILALYAPAIANKISDKTFSIASFGAGFYAGIFGAGIGLLLIALLRVKYPREDQIAHVKIQARFAELLLVISAVITHILHGNIIAAIWIPWSIGALVGGYFAGIILHKIGKLPGKAQMILLYAAFAVALVAAIANSTGLLN